MTRRTVCNICFWQCAATLYTENGKPWKVEGNPNDPHCNGRLCTRGTGGIASYSDPDRLRQPLIRVTQNGKQTFKPVSWDEAFETIAERVGRSRERHGGEDRQRSGEPGGEPRGDLGGDWKYDAWFTLTDANENQFFVNDVSRSRLAQGVLVDPATGQCTDTSGGCVPVNPFGAGNISPEAVEFIRISNVQNTTEREQTLASIYATGPLADLWAGPVNTAIGLEWRRDQGDFTADEVLFQGDTLGFRGESSISGTEEVWELYGEAVVPLAEGKAWTDYLGIEVGARYSDYKLAGGHWTYKLGGEWAIPGGLRGVFSWRDRARSDF